MASSKRITVRGKQRSDIDPLVLLHVLLAIAEEREHEDGDRPVSPDVFGAAIADLQESPG
jgi:hypothetical protein